MLSVTPNLHFSGQCKQAIGLYEQALHAQVKSLLCESEADPGDWLAAEDTKDLVYHCEMSIGGQRITLNDAGDASSLLSNHSMSLIVTFPSADEVKTAYLLMSDGATIIHPMHSTSYSSCFVSLVDRFGMRWELMTEQTDI